jgi:hypothetical protein
MRKRISGTYRLAVDPAWRQVTLDEIYLECDTSSAPVTINLFEISELNDFWNVKIYVSDISDNAGTNNITINTGGSDEIDGDGNTSVVISSNGGAVALKVVSSTQWMGLESVSSGGALPYKIYSALLTQTGTNAPVATILQNTLSGTPVWSRASIGDYRVTLAGEFTLNKTAILIGNKEFTLSPSAIDPYDVVVGQVSVNELYVDTPDNVSLVDGKLGNNTIPFFIEIRVYP